MNMGNIHLVTGFAGKQHVTAADQAAFNSALLGGGQFVLPKGNQFSASIVTNNQVRVLDGDICMQGRHIRLNEGSYVDLTIENGTSDYMRNDLIVVRYTRNAGTGVEDANLVVIKGTAVKSNPADPAYNTGDLIKGNALVNDMPLYRVPLNGIAVQDLVPLFTVDDPTISKKQDKTDLLTAETSLADADYIPFYDTSTASHRKVLWSRIKTVLGSVFAAKSHSHSISDVTSLQSTLNGKAASVHEHAAHDITSGILAVARGGTGVASLTALAKALGGTKIQRGSYSGTGTHGSSNKNSLTFDFVPDVVIVMGEGVISFFVNGCTSGYGLYTNLAGHSLYTLFHAATWNGKTLSWYCSGDYSASDGGSYTKTPSSQLNASGTTYHYIAIGSVETTS